MSDHSQLTLSQLLGALSRHRYKAFAAWLAVMIFVVAAFILLPRKYGSEGILYVQMGRTNSSVNSGTGSSSVSVQDTRETEIRSVVEIIRSRAVLESVVDAIGADAILTSPWDKWLPSLSMPKFGSDTEEGGSKFGLSDKEYTSLRKRERATKELSSSLTVVVEKQTSVVKIYSKAYSPVLAQAIVKEIMERTRTVHLDVHSSRVSAIFFKDQFENQEKQVVAAVQRLSQFRNDRQILSIEAEKQILQDILSQLEKESLMAEVDLEKSAEGLKKLQAFIAETASQIATPKTGVERLSFEDSRTEVFKLESERARLASTHNEGHPAVVQIDNQLKRVRSSLEKMTGDRTESESRSNPIFEQIKVDLIRAETEFAASGARLKSLQKKHIIRLAQLQDLNAAETVSDQLKRNVEVAKQYLGNYTQKRGEAVSLASLDDRQISDIIPFQQATLGLKHISPRGSIFLPLGFIAGLLAALAAALFCERNHLSPSLNESDVEKIIGLPVLVTLPRVYSSQKMVH